MKKSQLDELLRLITKCVLQEYMSTSSDISAMTKTAMDSKDGDSSSTFGTKEIDPNDPELSAFEKSKARRDAAHQRLVALKQKKLSLSAKKKEVDFRKQELDRMKRIDLPQATKDVQSLQGAKI